MASTLTVLTTPTMDGAEALLDTLIDLQGQQLISIDDAAYVKRDVDGKPKVKQANNLVGAGALGGAFWGLLFGALFMVPWLGAAIGAATGAIGGKMADFGIDDDFIDTVSAQIQPGTSALFLLSHGAVRDKIVPALEGQDFDILHTNLPEEQEAELRSAFSL